MTGTTERRRNAILGALVADAAALGLHWLYDQKQVAVLANGQPEFVSTTPADYDGYPAYYAHAARQTGDFSQYGEQAFVMLQSLAANGGNYNKAHYQQAFCTTFGYGGRYVGYIDRPTRDTLNRVTQSEQQALATAKAQPFSGSASDQQMMITKVIANMQKHSGTALSREIETAVRLTHDDDAMVSYALSLVDHLSDVTGFHGADDVQLPAVSKLPALVAACHGDPQLDQLVESAVRVTNNADLSVESGQLFATMLGKAIEVGTVESALQAMLHTDSESIGPIMQAAHNHANSNSVEVIAEIGMSCNLEFGLPGSAHILSHTSNYSEAVRTNILAGGDSCGRAIVVGAIAGAAYGAGGENGIPVQWIEKLNQLTEVNELLDALIPA